MAKEYLTKEEAVQTIMRALGVGESVVDQKKQTYELIRRKLNEARQAVKDRK